MKGILKRAAAAAFVLVFCAPAGASANSGPVYWESAPSFSMTPLQDCPVRVDVETLTFDFSGGLKSVDQYSPAAAVTADYKMSNPTGRPLTVQMAFPLIASLADLSQTDGIRITAGGKDVPFRIAPGVSITNLCSRPVYYNFSGSLVKTCLPSFSAILQSVKSEKPVLKKFAGRGKLYRVAYGGSARVLASFDSAGRNAAVLATAVNGVSQSSFGLQIEGYIQATLPSLGVETAPPFSLLVFGSRAEPVVTVSPEGGGPQQASKSATASSAGRPPDVLGNRNVQTGEQEAETFVNELVKRSAVYRKYPSQDLQNRLTWTILQNAEASVRAGNPVFSDSSVYDFYNQARVIVLAYEVAFPANGTADVCVKYPMGGTMDARSTSAPVHTSGYLLNPAKGWASFRGLSIKITPPVKEPFVVKSSIPLTRDGSGSYSASLKTLPEDDLVFSIYPKEVTEPKGSGTHRAAVLALIGISALLLACLGLCPRLTKKHRSNKP